MREGKKIAELSALLKMQSYAHSKVILSSSALFVITMLFHRIQSGFGCIKLSLFFPGFSLAVSEYVILNTLHSWLPAQ